MVPTRQTTGVMLADSPVRQLKLVFEGMLPADSRTKNAIAGSGAMMLARLVTMVASYLLVAILARYLSRSEFGLYAVLTSYMALTGGLDFGFGNGLRNKLVVLGCLENGGDTQARQYFLSALYALSLLVG